MPAGRYPPTQLRIRSGIGLPFLRRLRQTLIRSRSLTRRRRGRGSGWTARLLRPPCGVPHGFERFDNGLPAIKDTRQVDKNSCVPLFEQIVFAWSKIGNSGVVNQHIETIDVAYGEANRGLPVGVTVDTQVDVAGCTAEFFGVYRDQRQLLISEAIELRHKVESSEQSPS